MGGLPLFWRVCVSVYVRVCVLDRRGRGRVLLHGYALKWREGVRYI